MGNKFHFHVSASVKEQILLFKYIYIIKYYIYVTKVAGTNDPSSRLILPAVRDNPENVLIIIALIFLNS